MVGINVFVPYVLRKKMKFCPKCKITKSKEYFYKDKSRKQGRGSLCKTCMAPYQMSPKGKIRRQSYYIKNKDKILFNRKKYVESHRDQIRKRTKNYLLKKKYNINIDEYNNLLKFQNYSCAICDKNIKNDKRASVDHCHKTFKNRGILCMSCNTALGSFKDDILLLLRAAIYLSND